MMIIIIIDEVDVILTRLFHYHFYSFYFPFYFFPLLIPFYSSIPSSPLLHQAAPHLSTARLCPFWAPGASGRLASLRKKQLRTATYDSPANMCSYETIGTCWEMPDQQLSLLLLLDPETPFPTFSHQ